PLPTRVAMSHQNTGQLQSKPYPTRLSVNRPRSFSHRAKEKSKPVQNFLRSGVQEVAHSAVAL
ncbi:hypothetical protein, partial [Pseudomonas fluorescens]|uniref:hypothetical protein n=1 Tax=Pseudomonas fluorescens TaxID=294 RepID=UPI001CD707F6